MAIGLGRIFGFHFLENFNYPYSSRSVSEFWRRWHISLSTWFRDYVYIPLGGSRCTKRRQARNLIVVFLLTGLWHGAAWSFVIWGLYYAVLLLGERFVWGDKLDRAPGVLRHGYTMLLVIMGWVLFRADTLGYALGMVGVMCGGAASLWDGRTIYYLKEYGWALALGLAAALPWKLKAEALMARHKDSPLAGFAASWGAYGLALGLLALSYLQLLSSAFNPFIYFRF
jgi:alginate O-acetyltransferase complex protein AlgI